MNRQKITAQKLRSTLVQLQPFNCDHCDEKFVLKEDLRVHERIHTREKTFKCHNCDKTFVQKDDLRVHERLHTGEKPFNCYHCDKKFVQKDNLREHLRTTIQLPPL